MIENFELKEDLEVPSRTGRGNNSELRDNVILPLLWKYKAGEKVGNTWEIIDSHLTLNPYQPFLNVLNRPFKHDYLEKEHKWYMSQDLSIKGWMDDIKIWNFCASKDDKQVINSNYGWCIQSKYGFDQWEFVKKQLTDNPNTRQAVIHIKTADDTPSKDVNCTVCLQFFIREGKLYMTTYMRSNDLWMGFTYDVFQFTCMQILMSMQLGIPLGTYTHIAGSLHLYKRDLDSYLSKQSK